MTLLSRPLVGEQRNIIAPSVNTLAVRTSGNHSPATKGNLGGRLFLNTTSGDDMTEERIFTVRPSFLAYPWLLFLWSWVYGLGLLIILYKRLESRYHLTSQRLIFEHGVIARSTHEIELYRIKGVSLKQSLFDRLLSVGDVEVFCTDDGAGTSFYIRRISNPAKIKEIIRNECNFARSKEKIMVTEHIQT